MDAACRRGVSIKVRSVASICSILKIGLDRAFSTEAERSDGEPRATETSVAATTSTEQMRPRSRGSG